MTTDPDTAGDPWVWVPTLPGWIEVAAFETDDAALAHWRDMVEPVRTSVGDENAEDLYRMLTEVRRTIAGAPVSAAGLVITSVEEEMVVWTFSTAVEHVDTREVNPVALVERGLQSAATPEEVTLSDGRRGILLQLVTEAAALPGVPAGTLGQCVVAVALPGRPHDVVLVSASSTSSAGRDLLAMAAMSIADGITVGTTPPDDAVDRGVLTGPPDAGLPQP